MQEDLIILNEVGVLKSGLKKELEQYLKNGGQLLLIPKGKSDLQAVNRWLRRLKAPTFSKQDTVAIRMKELDKQLSFYDRVFDKQLTKIKANQKVDLPIIKKYYPINIDSRTDKLLQTQGGKVILSASNIGQGKLYQLAMPLKPKYSQLPGHALFVAVFYQMVMQTRDQKSLYETIGSSKPISMVIPNHLIGNNTSDEVLHIIKGEVDWIPETKRHNKNEYQLINIQWPQEGIFDVRYKLNTIEQIAANYSRSESDFSVWETQELFNEITIHKLTNFQILNTTNQQLSSKIIQLDHGQTLWKWFIFLTIIFIFVETIVLRLWK